MIEAIYASAWHHPGIAWAANLALLAFGVRKAPEHMRRFLIVAALAIMLDAWLTGALAPAWAKEHGQAIGIVFVIAGDLRYFYLLERSLLRATLLALVVPIAQSAMMKLWPELFTSSRVIFLSYEALFVLFCVALWQLRYAPKTKEPFLFRLTAFELVQYTLWATIDVLLLNGLDAMLLVRILPNILYYGGFLWFCCFASPRSPQQTSP